MRRDVVRSGIDGAGRRLRSQHVATFLIVLACTNHALAASDYDVEPDPVLSIRSLLDLRLVGPGQAPSWTDRGPAKTRYGGRRRSSGSSERVIRFALAKLALEPSLNLPWHVRAHAQLDWAADIDDEGEIENDEAPRLIEGWLRREWSTRRSGWGLQVGVNNPPLAAESQGPAWTPSYTLTPAALTTWIWEEGRVVGAEGEWWHESHGGTRIGALFGGGWGPDQAGILLAQRGWVLSDRPSGINSSLPLLGPAGEADVFDELDGRPAIYFAMHAADPRRIVQIRAGYFDNLGDDSTTGVWEARYGTGAVGIQPIDGLDILLQGLLGRTSTRTNRFKSTISAWFPLVSYRYRAHRVAVRYDHFRIDDDDGFPPTRERGHAITAAYTFEVGLRHAFGVEYVWADSERPEKSSPDPNDNQWQLSYRFRY
jgi:hypothetical protein